MGLFSSNHWNHGSMLRNLVRKIFNSFFFLDHITSNRKNLAHVHASFNLSEIQSPLIVYATYGDLGADNIEALKKQFGTRLMIIENVNRLRDPNPNSNYIRLNRGFDLAMFKDALRIISDGGYIGDVLLINSSAQWNIVALDRIIYELQESQEVIFLTKSFQGVEHFQSFFIYVPQKLVANFLLFVERNWRNWRLKRTAVVFGEQRTCSMSSNHIPTRAFYDFSSLLGKDELKQVNPSLHLVPRFTEAPPFVKYRR